MYAARHGLKHFYVTELAKCINGDLVIPLRWYTIDGIMHFAYFRVKQRSNRSLYIDEGRQDDLPAESLKYNLLDLKKQRPDLSFNGQQSNFTFFETHR